jgi:hypothetical protein
MIVVIQFKAVLVLTSPSIDSKDLGNSFKLLIYIIGNQ